MDLRIQPIEKPKGILRRLMYYYLKKEFGKVTMPAKVIYARYPKIALLIKKVFDVEKSLKLTNELEKILIRSYVSSLNGCPFCIDIAKKSALNKNLQIEKLTYLISYKDSDKYTDREKIILMYVEEMTKNITVTDKTYSDLKKYCDDKEIIEITYIATSENFLNRLIKPLNIGSDELCSIN